MSVGIATVLVAAWIGVSHLFGSDDQESIGQSILKELESLKKSTKKMEKKTTGIIRLDDDLLDLAKDEPVDIPAYLKPFVVKAERVRGINYVQLNVPNQGSKQILKAVEKEGTCGCHAVRGAFFLNEFLSRSSEKQKIESLEKLQSERSAIAFLEKLKKRKLTISWLEMNDIQALIGATNAEFKKRATVLDTVVLEGITGLKHDIGRILQVREEFFKSEDFYHIFILNSGDLTQGSLNSAIGDVERQQGKEFNQASVYSFLDRHIGGNHYYAIALEKISDTNTFTCYIIDSISTNDHIANWFFYYRNCYLCEFFAHGGATYDFG